MTSTRIGNNRSIVFSFVLLTFISSAKFTQSNAEKCNNCTCMQSTSVECINISLPITPVSEPENATTNNPLSEDNKDVIKFFIPYKNFQSPNLTPTNNHTSRNVSKDLSDLKDVVKSVSNNSVELIDLSRRNLTSLLGLFLRTLQLNKVQLLNLSANHLDVLIDSGFSGFTSLKCLDLAENNVSLIQDNAFQRLVSLQHLNLSRNHLRSLKDDTFKGLSSLQQLDLSFNHLSTITPGSLELSSLTRLVLAGNSQLGTGEASLFLATGKRLQTIDASEISIGQVPSAMTHSIRTLHLASNKIKIVNRGDMDSYPLLQLLDLTANDLIEIEEDALGRLEMLAILYLTNNNLVGIPHSLPERLKVIHLEYNNIEVLRPVDLDGMNQLEVLLLNGNRIKQVADGAFSQMASLVSLDLSANPLRELPAGILAGPLGLRVLRLGHLNVSMPTVKEAAFPLPSTEHLITLDVRGSPALAKQLLADVAALAAARELQELELSECRIQYLPTDMLHYLPQLRSLHLRNNNLNCSGLEWLAEWMRRQEVGEYREVYCQSPGELWGTLLVDLQSLQETNIEQETTLPYSGKSATTSIPHLVNTSGASDFATTIKSKFAHKSDDIIHEQTSAAKRDDKDAVSKVTEHEVNSYAMNILRQDAKVTTPPTAPTYQHPRLREDAAFLDGNSSADADRKKVNGNLKVARPLEQNDVIGRTITSTIWPKAIKTGTIASTTSIPLSYATSTFTKSSRTSSTSRSNLFMKNSSARKVPTEYLKHDNEEYAKDSKSNSANTNDKHIKSMSLIENKQTHASESSESRGEASRYSTTMIENKRQRHPGMYLLIIGIMVATLVLITLSSRMSRGTRDDLQELRAYQQDQGDLIEVSSLPSVSELW